MRFRSKSSFPDTNGSVYYGVSDRLFDYATGTTHYADIWDELLPKSDFRTRNCRHISGKIVRKPFTFRESDYPNSEDHDHWHNNACVVDHYHDFASWTGGYTHKLCDFRVETIIHDSQRKESANDGDDSFNSRAYEAMKPSLEQSVSLTNFLLELGDLKQILRLFSPTRDISKRISEGHLTWSFGIKPVISDVAEIWNSLHNYEKRIAEFLERSKTPQKRYYSETDEDPEGTNEDHTNYWNYNVKRSMTCWHRKKVKRVATMSYNYDVEPIKTLRQELRALRGILGLKFTPSVVWEAIPFSFVVDWFLNVGKWLESREDDVIQPDVIVTDYSISYKVQYEVVFNYSVVDGKGDSRSHDKCYVGHVSLYDRRRVIPDTGGTPLQLSGLTPNQLALSASLINVRR